jgi:hypothetical protein
MLADPLTKGLPPNVFGEHVTAMGLRESLWILDGPRGDPSEWISVLWLVNLIVIIIKMTHARYIYLWWSGYPASAEIKEVLVEIERENVSFDLP